MVVTTNYNAEHTHISFWGKDNILGYTGIFPPNPDVKCIILKIKIHWCYSIDVHGIRQKM